MNEKKKMQSTCKMMICIFSPEIDPLDYRFDNYFMTIREAKSEKNLSLFVFFAYIIDKNNRFNILLISESLESTFETNARKMSNIG